MRHRGFSEHDHAACIAETMAAAEAHCAREGLRLTPVRRRVLEILLGEHKAQGAYDILAQLAEDGLGSQPPVAYRALEFLTRIGFVHRIECLNAYVACARPGARHAPGFLICRKCHGVAETGVAPDRGTLGRAAAASGFRIETAVQEVEGLCPDCQSPAQADRDGRA